MGIDTVWWVASWSASGHCATAAFWAEGRSNPLTQWTDDLTLVLHDQPEPDAEQGRMLANRGVRVISGRAEKVAESAGRLTGLVVDGEVVAADAVVVAGFMRARSDVLTSLGLEAVDFKMGEYVAATHVPAEPTGLTAVPGVYVAGNVTDPGAQVIASAAAGLMAGASINMELIMADASR
ncbi:MAG: hypothetical protein H0X12_09685 [Nocardioides sp.]|nr:hypothetical protein [Nocardioides sp.]